jgi:hypothetical protein
MNQVFPSLLTIETFIIFDHEHKDKIKSIYVIRKGRIWTIKWARKDIDSSLQHPASAGIPSHAICFQMVSVTNLVHRAKEYLLRFARHRQKQ